MTVRLLLPEYQLFPYERVLAAREVVALGGEIIREEPSGFIINGSPSPHALRLLTYVSRVELEDGSVLRPDAARIEANSRIVRGRQNRRQITRYHLHGIHEYKGKFNPQVVRAFANLLSAEPGTWLVDPFCGSGTSLLEGLSLGMNVLGIDKSPMATFLSRAKVRAFGSRDPMRTARQLELWWDRVKPDVMAAQASETESDVGLAHLDDESLAYVRHWFPPGATAGLSAALAHRQSLKGTPWLLAGVAVSSVCRMVSMQRPEDLRIRRRPPGFIAPPIEPLLESSIGNVVCGLRELSGIESPVGGHARIRLASAATPSMYSGIRAEKRRMVISSPPYATALPYIDTDRLSITLLGLGKAGELGSLERSLAGSREWKTEESRQWSHAVQVNRDKLPDQALALCRDLAAAQAEAGFRRRAVAGLLYRYLVLMRRSLIGLRTGLSAGDQAVFIVGSNRTTTPDGPVGIPTPDFLALVAEQAGFEVQEILPLDTFPRFGLHQANGINQESAVVLSLPRH